MAIMGFSTTEIIQLAVVFMVASHFLRRLKLGDIIISLITGKAPPEPNEDQAPDIMGDIMKQHIDAGRKNKPKGKQWILIEGDEDVPPKAHRYIGIIQDTKVTEFILKSNLLARKKWFMVPTALVEGYLVNEIRIRARGITFYSQRIFRPVFTNDDIEDSYKYMQQIQDYIEELGNHVSHGNSEAERLNDIVSVGETRKAEIIQQYIAPTPSKDLATEAEV